MDREAMMLAAEDLFSPVAESPSVELEGVKIAYAPHGAATFSLSVATAAIDAGGIHCIYGTNGSGKSSLLRLLAGAAQPRQGTIRWKGLRQPPAPGVDCVLVTQAGPWPHWSAMRNIVEPMLEQGLQADVADARARSLVEILGLEGLEARHAHQLSGGQQQRVVLARALALAPKAILLDETMSAQSEAWAWRIGELLLSFAEKGRLVIVVSHDPDWVTRFSRRVTHLEADNGDAGPSTPFSAGYHGEMEGWVAYRRGLLSATGGRGDGSKA